MALNTTLTYLLPDSVNRRKPTLREYAKQQHAMLEERSVEMVQIKNEEEEKKPDTVKQQNQDEGLCTSPVVVPPKSSN